MRGQILPNERIKSLMKRRDKLIKEKRKERRFEGGITTTQPGLARISKNCNNRFISNKSCYRYKIRI